MTDETKHSPEPWHVWGNPTFESQGIDSQDGDAVVHRGHDGDGGVLDPANARRIVACVNALAGIPTAALEAGALETALRRLDVATMAAEEDGTAHVSTRSLATQARAALNALGRGPGVSGKDGGYEAGRRAGIEEAARRVYDGRPGEGDFARWLAAEIRALAAAPDGGNER